jgi:hypothetical protein
VLSGLARGATFMVALGATIAVIGLLSVAGITRDALDAAASRLIRR